MSSAPSSQRSRQVSRRVVPIPSDYVPVISPYKTNCCGIAMTTCIATLIASLFYGLSLILILAVKCTFTHQVIYFFSFVLLALIATITMAGINIAFPRYHFNCIALSASLFYSGTIFLILFGLVYTSIEGLCPKPNAINIDVTSTTQSPAANSTVSSTTPKQYQFLYVARDEEATKPVGLWQSKFLPNYFIWCFAAMGSLFQATAHYYYG